MAYVGYKNDLEALVALVGEAFDLVLMDVQMPEMDRFEATAAMCAQERDQLDGRLREEALGLVWRERPVVARRRRAHALSMQTRPPFDRLKMVSDGEQGPTKELAGAYTNHESSSCITTLTDGQRVVCHGPRMTSGLCWTRAGRSVKREPT